MFFSKKFYGLRKMLSVFALGVGTVGLCVGGCVPKEEWAFRCGNVTVSSGLYVNLLVDDLIEAQSALTGGRMKSGGFNYKLLHDAKKGPISVFDDVKRKVDRKARYILMAERVFDELDGKKKNIFVRNFSEVYKNYDEYIDGVDRIFNAKPVGLDKQAFVENDEVNAMVKYVIGSQFGKGKPRHITNEKVNEFIKQNFVKFKVVTLPKAIDNIFYRETKDSAPGSKLEKKAGVKTPKDLAEKYMKQIKDGGSIDDVAESYSEFVSGNKVKPNFVTICKVNSEEFPDKVNQDLKKIVGDLEVDSGAVLKEDAQFYYVLQRFNLDDEDLKNNAKKAKGIYTEQEIEKYFEELLKKYKDKIEVNEGVLRKYSPENQAKIMGKHVRKTYAGEKFID